MRPALSPRVAPLAVGIVAIGALALGGCDLPSTASAQDDDSDEAVRQTPQYGAPDYQPNPPPPPPPSTQNRDAGVPVPRASS